MPTRKTAIRGPVAGFENEAVEVTGSISNCDGSGYVVEQSLVSLNCYESDPVVEGRWRNLAAGIAGAEGQHDIVQVRLHRPELLRTAVEAELDYTRPERNKSQAGRPAHTLSL